MSETSLSTENGEKRLHKSGTQSRSGQSNVDAMSAAVPRKARLLAAALVGCIHAQFASPRAENRVQAHSVASKWIGDVDPKHRAWAAELIAQYQLQDLYPELETQLERFQESRTGVSKGSADELALEVIVDAIIKLQLRTPAREAEKLYPTFPALALILLSRPSDDNRSALYSIFTKAKVGEVWLAAADLLAENPPQGFVLRVLSDFQEFVRILVYAPGKSGGMSYGDCVSLSSSSSGLAVPPDWPAIEIYSLQTARHGGAVIALGEHSISFVSHKSSNGTPWTGKSGCGGLDLQSLRHDLIAQLAGVDPGKLGLRSLLLSDITLKSEEAYNHEMVQLLQGQARAFSAAVRTLVWRRLLTAEQASGLQLHIELHIIPMDLLSPLPAVPEKALAGISITR